MEYFIFIAMALIALLAFTMRGFLKGTIQARWKQNTDATFGQAQYAKDQASSYSLNNTGVSFEVKASDGTSVDEKNELGHTIYSLSKP